MRRDHRQVAGVPIAGVGAGGGERRTTSQAARRGSGAILIVALALCAGCDRQTPVPTGVAATACGELDARRAKGEVLDAALSAQLQSCEALAQAKILDGQRPTTVTTLPKYVPELRRTRPLAPLSPPPSRERR